MHFCSISSFNIIEEGYLCGHLLYNICNGCMYVPRLKSHLLRLLIVPYFSKLLDDMKTYATFNIFQFYIFLEVRE